MSTKMETIENAASRIAEKRYGKKTVARRTTGDFGLSGWFAAYQPAGENSLSKIGEDYHVWHGDKAPRRLP